MDVITNGKAGLREYITDIFFPNRCPFCGGFIRYDRYCCEECFGEILWSDGNICEKCGKPLSGDCLCKNSPAYDLCACASYYSGKAKEGIYSLKYKNNLNSAAVFGRFLRERLEIMGVFKDIDICVPVPMSKRQIRQRGYNQAEVLAKEIVGESGIPVRTDLIIRRYSKLAQHTLSAAERAVAAAKTYYTAAEGTPLAGMTVLLTDDVLTTGSTLDACAALLRELGAEKVICAAAATV